MSKRNKALLLCFVLLLLAAYLLLPGFCPVGSVCVSDCAVSPDGSTLTLSVDNASSAGYIRKMEMRQQGGKLYLTPVAAFGGINGHFGAKTTFVFTITEDTGSISIYRAENTYEEILIKDENGSWKSV